MGILIYKIRKNKANIKVKTIEFCVKKSCAVLAIWV